MGEDKKKFKFKAAKLFKIMINTQNCEQTISGLTPPHLVLTLMHGPFILWT
jgi:hypothetical protein